MSVRDNLLLGAHVTYARRGRREVETALTEVYDLFPILLERSRLPAASLSGGEQQMLAIGRALMARPRALLLDEPSMGLAPLVIAQIADVLRKIKELGITMLLIEQNPDFAFSLADRCCVLESGHVVIEGETHILRNDEQMASLYLGGAMERTPASLRRRWHASVLSGGLRLWRGKLRCVEKHFGRARIVGAKLHVGREYGGAARTAELAHHDLLLLAARVARRELGETPPRPLARAGADPRARRTVRVRSAGTRSRRRLRSRAPRDSRRNGRAGCPRTSAPTSSRRRAACPASCGSARRSARNLVVFASSTVRDAPIATPYCRPASSTVISARRTSRATLAGSRSSGSP